MVEIVGVLAVILGLALGVVNIEFAVLFVLVAYGFSLVMTAWTLALEQWTYRGYGRLSRPAVPALDLALRRSRLPPADRGLALRGLVEYTRGSREWGVMTREGFGPAEEITEPRP